MSDHGHDGDLYYEDEEQYEEEQVEKDPDAVDENGLTAADRKLIRRARIAPTILYILSGFALLGAAFFGLGAMGKGEAASIAALLSLTLGLSFIGYVCAARGASFGDVLGLSCATFMSYIYFLVSLVSMVMQIRQRLGPRSFVAPIIMAIVVVSLSSARKRILTVRNSRLYRHGFPSPGRGGMMAMMGTVFLALAMLTSLGGGTLLYTLRWSQHQQAHAFKVGTEEMHGQFMRHLNRWSKSPARLEYDSVQASLNRLEWEIKAINSRNNPWLIERKKLYLEAVACWRKGIELIQNGDKANGIKLMEKGDALKEKAVSYNRTFISSNSEEQEAGKSQ